MKPNTVKFTRGVNQATTYRPDKPMAVNICVHLGTDTTISAERYISFETLKVNSESGDVILFVGPGGLVALRDAIDATVRCVTDPELTNA